MVATLDGWRRHGQRELPWLAGPCLSALRRASVDVPASEDLRVVERFLVGAEGEAAAVAAAVAALADDDAPPAVPPDARGALAAAVDRFFALLVEAYSELHPAVVSGHRRDADDTIAVWQPRLDDAADDVEERAMVLSGERQSVSVVKRPWGTRDRPGCALGFVGLALLAAAAMVWAVLHGWPMQPISFGA